MRMSGCDRVVAGQGVSISDTEVCAAFNSTGRKGYFPVANQLKRELVETKRVKFWAKSDCLKSG